MIIGSFDEKEQLSVAYYKEKFEEDSFNEYDVKDFLIMIRHKLPKDSYLRNIANSVAHRERNYGKEIKDIKNIIKNNFKVDDQGQLEDFEAMPYECIVKEIKQLGADLLIIFSEKTICEVLACIFSILNGVSLKINENSEAKYRIIQGNENDIGLCVDLGKKMVCYSLINSDILKKEYPGGIIRNCFDAVREKDELVFRCKDGSLA